MSHPHRGWAASQRSCPGHRLNKVQCEALGDLLRVLLGALSPLTQVD